MASVETVRGAVDVGALGRTLMHEHVLIMQPEAVENYGTVWGASYWDEEVRVADAIAKLSAVREAWRTASARSRRWWRRATRTGSTCRTTPPASSTS